MLLNLFNTAWQDVSIVDNDVDKGRYYSKVFKQLYIISFTILLPLVPITKIAINLVVEDSYKSAASYISFLYLGTIFQAFSSFYGVGYLRNKQTKQASLTSVYGAIVNAVVNLILVKFIGLQAASISTFLGFFVMWIVREKQNRDELGIHINIGNFTKFFIPILIFCIVLCISNMFVDILFAIIGALIFIKVNFKYLYNLFKYLLLLLRKIVRFK